MTKRLKNVRKMPRKFPKKKSEACMSENAEKMSQILSEECPKNDEKMSEKKSEAKKVRKCRGNVSKTSEKCRKRPRKCPKEVTITILRHFLPIFRKLEKAVAVSGVCAGVLEENCGKVPGKLLENFSRIAKATNSRISGTGKDKPAGNLGPTLPGPCPNLPCRVFFGPC